MSAPAADDGRRILVEQWWPRGVSWRRAAIDGWLPDLAPSGGLRWRLAYGSDNWAALEALYKAELEGCGARSDAQPCSSAGGLPAD